MTLIAVTSMHNYKDHRSSLSDNYIEALELAGGIPVILPPSLSPEASVQALKKMDGLLLSGGPDLSPLYFGQQPQPHLRSIDALRDQQEIALIKAAREQGMPIFAICRGIQVLNAVLGGTITQHIDETLPGAIQHSQKAPQWHRHHHITIKSETMLASILGEGTIGVNSYHHQVVDKVAPGLMVSAVAPDGLVEAVECASPWTLAVQWHPEMMWRRHGEFLRLFEAFVTACGGGDNEYAS